MQETEESIQFRVVQWLKYNYPQALYCASAGGVRTSFRQAIKMKRTGYIAGFPDLFIYEPRNGMCGLAIELKTLKGSASKEQKDWREKLIERGYVSHICKGYDAAIQAISNYMGNG